jgi:hypothetical protein
MVLLVPKQLRRAGMTGDVPYYGGRLTPAQIHGLTHPSGRPPPGMAPRQPVPMKSQGDPLGALRHLLDTGVISPEEYRQLSARVTR